MCRFQQIKVHPLQHSMQSTHNTLGATDCFWACNYRSCFGRARSKRHGKTGAESIVCEALAGEGWWEWLAVLVTMPRLYSLCEHSTEGCEFCILSAFLPSGSLYHYLCEISKSLSSRATKALWTSRRGHMPSNTKNEKSFVDVIYPLIDQSEHKKTV